MQIEPATVLTVDDDPLLREFAKMRLTRPNVTIEAAANGDEAWYRLGKGGIDIVLLDLEMPVMDGFELLGLIRSAEKTRHLPVVVATSRADPPAITRAFAVGATSFVIKPLVWDLVAHQLSYVLRVAREEGLVRQALLALRTEIARKDIKMAACLAKVDGLLSKSLSDSGGTSTNPEVLSEGGYLSDEIRRVLLDVRDCLRPMNTGVPAGQVRHLPNLKAL